MSPGILSGITEKLFDLAASSPSIHVKATHPEVLRAVSTALQPSHPNIDVMDLVDVAVAVADMKRWFAFQRHSHERFLDALFVVADSGHDFFSMEIINAGRSLNDVQIATSIPEYADVVHVMRATLAAASSSDAGPPFVSLASSVSFDQKGPEPPPTASRSSLPTALEIAPEKAFIDVRKLSIRDILVSQASNGVTPPTKSTRQRYDGQSVLGGMLSILGRPE